MSSERPKQTSVDYVVIAVNPMLIMGLVGSLAFFLLAIFYHHGEHSGRFHWVMMWFVMAAVLIARISMVEGAERASIFGAALAMATGLVMYKFVATVWPAWLVMAIIWWCAHRLTWDSTYIDDAEEGSGEGLLEAAGLDRPESAADQPDVTALDRRKPVLSRGPDDGLTSHDDYDADVPWWQQWFMRPRKGRPHAPGVGVVYFSLAALPAFGLGQLFVSAPEQRRYIFTLLCVYLASAIGLLLTTSLLGLRRYLRQRRLEMPPVMTGTWLAVGTTLGLALLVLAAILPLPTSGSIFSWRMGDDSSDEGQASRLAMIRESPAEGEGRGAEPIDADSEGQASGRSGEQGNPGDQGSSSSQQDGGEPAGAGKPSTSKSGESDSKADTPGSGEGGNREGSGSANSTDGSSSEGGQQGAGQAGSSSNAAGESDSNRNSSQDGQQSGGTGQTAGDGGQGQSPQGQGQGGQGQNQGQPNMPTQGMQSHSASSPDSSPPSDPGSADPPSRMPNLPQIGGLRGILQLLKWLFWAALAVVGLYFIVRYWRIVLEALADFGSFFRRRKKKDAGEITEDAPAPRRPFSSFADPFVHRVRGVNTREAVVRYTFVALAAWAEDHGRPRTDDETPLEFCHALAGAFPKLAADLGAFSDLYGRVVYAKATASTASLEPLRRLWTNLSAARPAVRQETAAS